MATSPRTCGDPTAKKLAKLVSMGYNLDQLRDCVELLGEISWSTVALEQGYGSCATVRRFHGECTGPVVSMRAMLHQCRHFFNPDPRDSMLGKLAARIDALGRQQAAFLEGICSSRTSTIVQQMWRGAVQYLPVCALPS